MDGNSYGRAFAGAFYTLAIGGLIVGIAIGAIGIKILGWIFTHLHIGWS